MATAVVAWMAWATWACKAKPYCSTLPACGERKKKPGRDAGLFCLGVGLGRSCIRLNGCELVVISGGKGWYPLLPETSVFNDSERRAGKLGLTDNDI
jgi:hypothetical protein